VPVPGDGRLPVPAAVPVPSDDDRGLADVSLSLDPDGSSVPLSGQPADASVPPSTLGALASLPAATALPLPLPLAEAVVPPVPWPRRRGGDVNADSLDFGPAFARLDSETRRLYQQAYDRFLEAAADGKTLTGREVGEACGRGDRWGRDRIAEVRAAQQRAAESKELATSVASQT
jgi:hypothetical protein